MFDLVPEKTPTTALVQTEGFVRALRAVGRPPLRLECGTVLQRRRFGPVAGHLLARADVSPACLQNIQATGATGPVLISAEAAFNPGGMPLAPLTATSYLAALDLSQDIDKLRSGLHDQWRSQLEKAEALPIDVDCCDMPERLGHWVLLKENGSRRKSCGTRWPAALTIAYASRNPGAAKLFTAHQGRAPLAGLLILRHGTSATCHIAQTRVAGRDLPVQNLLLWQAIRWLQANGASRLELGTLRPKENAKTAAFRRGTGAKVTPLGGTWLWWPPVTQLAKPVSRWRFQRLHTS